MNHRKLSRIVAPGILAAVLALPAAAQARDAGTRGPANLQHWLASLWEKGISILWTGSEAAQKIGHGIDPNGNPTAPNGGAPIGPGSQTELGEGIDPNG